MARRLLNVAESNAEAEFLDLVSRQSQYERLTLERVFVNRIMSDTKRSIHLPNQSSADGLKRLGWLLGFPVHKPDTRDRSPVDALDPGDFRVADHTGMGSISHVHGCSRLPMKFVSN